MFNVDIILIRYTICGENIAFYALQASIIDNQCCLLSAHACRINVLEGQNFTLLDSRKSVV